MRLEATIKRFIGLSTETKPRPGIPLDDGTILETLPPGSSFFEEDTGFIARWTGYTWTEAFPDVRTDELSVLQAILAELQADRREAHTGIPVDTNSLR